MTSRWQPTAAVQTLHRRAEMMDKIRAFFKARNILEVDTPLLSHATVTDPHLHSFETFLTEPGGKKTEKLYLQTSPEFAMKRLLAAGVGSIYQICKAFRNEESGRLHNPEFTLLEWYQLSLDHHQLMDEVDDFLCHILNTPSAKRLSYRELFLHYLQFDPHQATCSELKQYAKHFGLMLQDNVYDRDTWLQLFMTHLLEPKLAAFQQPVFVYDFPASQAALAKIREGNPSVAERFEVYIKGLEIANGYHELTDAVLQQDRFEHDLARRKILKYVEVSKDERLIAAIANGFPSCAGIAVGVDRLMMLATGKQSLAEVIAFPIEYA